MGDLIFKPTTGGSLKLQEDGGTDAISINTSGVATITNATITAGSFPAGHIINVTSGRIATETTMTATTTWQDILTVTPTLKKAGNKYLLRAIVPVYHYTGGSSMYYKVRIYRTTSTAAEISAAQIHRANETNTGETNNIVVEGFDASAASSTEYKVQIYTSTSDSYPKWCDNNMPCSLIIQEIQV